MQMGCYGAWLGWVVSTSFPPNSSKPGREPSPQTDHAGVLIVDSRLQNCEKINFCLSHSVSGILWHPKLRLLYISIFYFKSILSILIEMQN